MRLSTFHDIRHTTSLGPRPMYETTSYTASKFDSHCTAHTDTETNERPVDDKDHILTNKQFFARPLPVPRKSFRSFTLSSPLSAAAIQSSTLPVIRRMRRERRQQPLKRSSKHPASVKQHEEEASNFSLDSLKIKMKQEPQKSEPSSLMLILVGMVVMAIFCLSPTRLWRFPPSTPTTLPINVPPLPKAGNARQPPMLPKPGEYAPLRSNNIMPLIKLQAAPTSEYHIFSISSVADVAHDVLTNVLMGLFDQPDEHIGFVKWSTTDNQYLTRHQNAWADNNVTVVSHTLDTDTTHLQREFRSSYRNLFFLVVDRGQPECQIPQELIMMCIPQSDLLYHGVEDEKIAIGRIVQQMQLQFPYWSRVDFSFARQEAFRRLDCMADMQLQMQELPQSSMETKFGIRGGIAM